MTEAISIKQEQTITDVEDELSCRIENISAVGDLLGAIDSTLIHDKDVNKAGFLIARLADEADSLADELYGFLRGAS